LANHNVLISYGRYEIRPDADGLRAGINVISPGILRRDERILEGCGYLLRRLDRVGPLKDGNCGLLRSMEIEYRAEFFVRAIGTKDLGCCGRNIRSCCTCRCARIGTQVVLLLAANRCGRTEALELARKAERSPRRATPMMRRWPLHLIT